MKNNLNELFKMMLPELKASKGISIDEILDEIMPQIRFEDRPSKKQMAREIVRGRLTTMMNAEEIYSYEKGQFVYIENANEEQLKRFMDKAEKDIKAAEKRKEEAEMRRHQISMAWDANGNFIGFIVPEAMTV